MTVKFLYENNRGETKEHELIRWSEEGLYIHGVNTEHQHRTFLKYNVIMYLEGEDLLKDPYPNQDAINAHLEQLKSKPKNQTHKTEICFTGFAAVQKAALIDKAKAAGLHVVTDITVNLQFLVAGPTRGPAKMKKARLKGVIVLLQHEFFNLLETGELPDGEDDLV